MPAAAKTPTTCSDRLLVLGLRAGALNGKLMGKSGGKTRYFNGSSDGKSLNAGFSSHV